MRTALAWRAEHGADPVLASHARLLQVNTRQQQALDALNAQTGHQ